MSKYKVLIFDADGTLFDFEKSEFSALKKAFLKFNLFFDKNVHLGYYKKLNFEIWSEFEDGKISAEDLKQERFRRYNEQFNLGIDPILFSDAYLEYLSEAAFLLDGAEELLTELSNKFEMILLTNGLTRVQNKRFEKAKMSRFFKKIIISEEVGFKKPQKEIFELALNDIQHNNKNDILMIGDNLRSDILGGINFGVDTCWYNPRNQDGSNEIIPTFRATTFLELLKIIG